MGLPLLPYQARATRWKSKFFHNQLFSSCTECDQFMITELLLALGLKSQTGTLDYSTPTLLIVAVTCGNSHNLQIFIGSIRVVHNKSIFSIFVLGGSWFDIRCCQSTNIFKLIIKRTYPCCDSNERFISVC